MVDIYRFFNAAGTEQTFETLDPKEAEQHARKQNFRVRVDHYEFSSSEWVWDYTGDDEDTCPNHSPPEGCHDE